MHRNVQHDKGYNFKTYFSVYYILPQNFLYKCIGVVIRKSTKKDFVNKMLDLIFSTVKHTDQTEREVIKLDLSELHMKL